MIHINSGKEPLFCMTMNNLLVYNVMTLEYGTKPSAQLAEPCYTMTLIWVELNILQSTRLLKYQHWITMFFAQCRFS